MPCKPSIKIKRKLLKGARNEKKMKKIELKVEEFTTEDLQTLNIVENLDLLFVVDAIVELDAVMQDEDISELLNGVMDKFDIEDSEDETLSRIAPRETHPFATDVPLIGGGRRRKKKPGKNRRPRVIAQGGIDQIAGRHGKLIDSMLKGDYQRNTIVPPSKIVALDFVDPGGVYQGATSFIVKHFCINDLYDPDPALLTTSYAGFSEWMRFYDYFRVEGIKCEWFVANNEPSVAVRVAMVCSTSPITPLTYQQAIDAVEGRFSSQFKELQRASGGVSTTKLNLAIKPEVVLGDATYYTDSLWYGTGSSSPLGQLWVNLFVVSVGSATNLTNGVTSTFSFRAVSKLWSVKVIFDPSYDMTRDGLPLPMSKSESTRKKNLAALKQGIS